MDIADKLTTVDEQISIQKYDNGYLIEVSGRDADDEWASAKILAVSIDDVHALIDEFATLPRTK